MKTFKCDFGSGVSCELQAPEKAPEKGCYRPLFQWTGNPNPKRLLRPYIAWVNSVNKLLCEEWKIKLLHIFMTGPGQTETWSYEPGKPPKKLNLSKPPR